MKKLLKLHELKSDMQYFQMVVDTFISGNTSTALQAFTAMPRVNRKQMVRAMVSDSWSVPDKVELFFFDQL